MLPNVCRHLMDNLKTRLRRGVLDLEEIAPSPETSTVYRTYRLTSEAARLPKYQGTGKGMYFSWQFASYDVEKGSHLLAVRADREWQECCTIPLSTPAGQANFRFDVMKSADRLKRSAGKGRTTECEITGSSLTLNIEKGDRLTCFVEGGVASKLLVLAVDLMNVLKVLDTLDFPPKASLCLATDKDASLVRLSFATVRGEYSLYIPRSTVEGKRVTHGLELMRLPSPVAA